MGFGILKYVLDAIGLPIKLTNCSLVFRPAMPPNPGTKWTADLILGRSRRYRLINTTSGRDGYPQKWFSFDHLTPSCGMALEIKGEV